MFRLCSEDMFGDESHAGDVANGELLSMETVFQTCVLLPETEEIKKQSRISDNGKRAKAVEETDDWILLESYLGNQDYNAI